MSGQAIRHPNALKWMAFGLVVLFLAGRRTPLLVWNATASAPIGLYLSVPIRHLARGDLVLAMPLPDVARFAASRGYLPLGVPLVKRIAALPGDVVCSVHGVIAINGRFVASALLSDGRGRPLPHWRGCLILMPGQVFLLMSGVRNSFDGRYFGPIPRQAIPGQLVPLWLR